MDSHAAGRVAVIDQRGFTVIELVAVLAVIILPASSLLTVMQKVREGASRERAATMLRDVCSAAVAFEQRNEAWPDSLEQLLGPTHPVSDGADGGRRYTLRVVNGWAVVADPLAGVTGDETAIISAPACELTFSPTPGAASGRTQMHADVAAAAARASSDLVALLTPEEQGVLVAEARGYVALEQTQRFVFEALDDDRGNISLASIASTLSCDGSVHPFSCDGSVRPIVLRFNLALDRALRLGVHDEDWITVPGIAPSVVAEPSFFDADTVAMLTSAFVHDPSLRQQLQAAIRQAANAEAAGIPGAQAMAIERLINGIERGIGRGVTTADGWTLQTLARMWLGQTPSTP